MGCGGLSKVAQSDSVDISNTTNFVSNVIQLQSSVLLPVVTSKMLDKENPSQNKNSNEASVSQVTETPVFAQDDRDHNNPTLNEVEVIKTSTKEFKLDAPTGDIEFLPKALFTRKEILPNLMARKNYLSSLDPELTSPDHQRFIFPDQRHDLYLQESDQEKMELTEVLLFSTPWSPEYSLPESNSLDKLNTSHSSPVHQLQDVNKKAYTGKDCFSESVSILSSTFESHSEIKQL